jgi:hypothetical protein
VPEGVTLLGVDEDTALMRLDPTPDEQGRTRWRVMGRQTVSLYLPGREDPAVFQAGEQVALRAE